MTAAAGSDGHGGGSFPPPFRLSQAAAPGSREQQAFVELLEPTQRLKTITRSLLLLAQSDASPLRLTRTRMDLSAEPNTSTDQSVSTTLTASDADGNTLTLRIVSQPAHGRVALANRTATYHPETGFAGQDAFTVAAWDGSTDSNLGTVTVTVVEGTCALDLTATGPTEVTSGLEVPFRAAAVVSGCAQPVRFEWTWDDLAEPTVGEVACRSFGQPGVVHWQLKATAGTAAKTLTVQANGTEQYFRLRKGP